MRRDVRAGAARTMAASKATPPIPAVEVLPECLGQGDRGQLWTI